MKRYIPFGIIAFWFAAECFAYTKHSLPGMGLCVIMMWVNYFIFKRIVGGAYGTPTR